MDTDIILAYLAIGGMTKLVTMRYPTTGQRWATALAILLGALAAGWIGDMLPDGYSYLAIGLVSLPFLGDVLGVYTGRLIDRLRMLADEGIGQEVDDGRTSEASGPDGGPAQWHGGMGAVERQEGAVPGAGRDGSGEVPAGDESGAATPGGGLPGRA